MDVDDAPLEHEAESDLGVSVRRLQLISVRLRVLGVLIFAGTVADVALAVFVRASVRVDEDFVVFYYEGYLAILGALACIVLILAVVHDQARRTGDVVFEEVSDELQWHRQKTGRTDDAALDRPLLPIRIALRRYAVSADLPLLRGRAGAAAYVGLNVAALLIAAFV